MNDDVAHFDRWSSRYDRSTLQRFFFGPIQEATIAEAALVSQDPKAVLDVGCGTGQLLRRLADRYPDAELVGVDPSPGMVHHARLASAPDRRVQFLNARAENLPFADGHFDLVVTTLSFHHWSDQEDGLREIRRVLRLSGVFVLTDVLAAGWFRRLIARMGRFRAPQVLDEMLVAQRLGTVLQVSVPWPRQVKVTLTRAVD